MPAASAETPQIIKNTILSEDKQYAFEQTSFKAPRPPLTKAEKKAAA